VCILRCDKGQRTGSATLQLKGSRPVPSVKPLYSNNDFDRLSWHDCYVWAVAFDHSSKQLLFDIDFISRWLLGQDPPGFEVVPSTLMFTEVTDFRLNVETSSVGLQIKKIEKVSHLNSGSPGEYHSWIIDCFGGSVEFNASEFLQFSRQLPVFSDCQSLPFNVRGGISVATTTFTI
jgi:hypothetical protein